MVREPMVSERVLRAVAVAAVILWSLVIVVVSLGFLGPNIGVTWAARIGLLALGALITAGLVRFGVSSWRRAIAQPLPAGRGSRWLARQPGWRLAVGCWFLYVAPEIAAGVWLNPRGHQPVATMPHIAGLVFSVLGASLVALLCRTLWRRQAQNSTAPAA